MTLRRIIVLSKFDNYIRRAMQEWQVPGLAAGIIDNKNLVYAQGFGTQRLGSNIPVNPETVFQVGSIAKTFTATLLAMMVDEGKFGWKDKVLSHLPDFRLHDLDTTSKLTVEDLVAQRSGLSPHAGHLLPHLGFDRQYIIKRLRYVKPVARVRSEYAYQNHLFLVAAALVEKYTGESWEKTLAERIFKPLGMKSTSATVQGYRDTAQSAHGHFYNGPLPTSPIKVLPKNWPYHYWIYTAGPAGGINSNVIDMAKWLRFNLNKGSWNGKRLISYKNMNYLYTPKIAAKPAIGEEATYYCAGWLKSEYDPHPITWHNGGTSGMKSIIAIIPEAQIGVVILCNLFNTLVPEALVRTFADLWFGNPSTDWSQDFLVQQMDITIGLEEPPGPRTLPRPLQNYIGTYYNKLYGLLSIVKKGSRLAIVMGPKKIQLNLMSWGGDTFIIHWPGVLTCGAGVQFFANGFGKIDRVTIEGMNDELTGYFRKISRRPEASLQQ